MKERVIVKRGDYLLYDGNILNIPLKDKYITELSIEIFDDDDPCIIHQSYVIKELVSKLLELFKEQDKSLIHAIDFKEEFDVIDFTDISSLTFELKVK
ncbi:MAG: hypothetical protein KQ78_01668 [Candidatus Izimaplasma bacterium HR2]|nr:MAG: hypothetical protein KQ78_01668 [Candidatus Izimaplasma bacterium HR2]